MALQVHDGAVQWLVKLPSKAVTEITAMCLLRMCVCPHVLTSSPPCVLISSPPHLTSSPPEFLTAHLPALHTSPPSHLLTSAGQ